MNDGARTGSSPERRQPARSDLYLRIYDAVRQIPEGSVTTYGGIARRVGLGRAARVVGYALHSLPDESDVPWQRVVNARGEISQRSEAGPDQLQRILLEEEGVVFDSRGVIDLRRYGWGGD